MPSICGGWERDVSGVAQDSLPSPHEKDDIGIGVNPALGTLVGTPKQTCLCLETIFEQEWRGPMAQGRAAVLSDHGRKSGGFDQREWPTGQGRRAGLGRKTTQVADQTATSGLSHQPDERGQVNDSHRRR